MRFSKGPLLRQAVGHGTRRLTVNSYCYSSRQLDIRQGTGIIMPTEAPPHPRTTSIQTYHTPPTRQSIRQLKVDTKRDISDYDGDSQMASSPESSNAGSRTPVTNPSNARAAELSPPGSHQTQKAAGISGGKGTLFGGAEMDRIAAQQQQQQQQQQRQQKQQQQKGKSGEGRLNRRAEEEYQRVMEYVVDKDFSLKEFGDPFDERDMEEELP